MLRINLAIDQGNSLLPEVLDVLDEGEFASVAGFGEHAFAEESVAHADAVEAACELVAEPCFGAVGQAHLVETDHGCFQFVGDPCSVLVLALELFAGTDHFGKSFVDGKTEFAAADDGLHALAYFEVFWKEHKAWVGTVPERRVAIVPGEDAFLVGEDQSFRAHVAADGEKAIFERFFNGWKPEFIIEHK